MVERWREWRLLLIIVLEHLAGVLDEVVGGELLISIADHPSADDLRTVESKTFESVDGLAFLGRDLQDLRAGRRGATATEASRSQRTTDENVSKMRQ